MQDDAPQRAKRPSWTDRTHERIWAMNLRLARIRREADELVRKLEAPQEKPPERP